MIPLRSLRNKVALLFFLITAAAFGAIYFIVVPQLEQNLKERRLASLEAEAKASKPVLEGLVLGEVSTKQLERRVRAVADSTDARLTFLGWEELPDGPQTGLLNLSFYAVFDSREERAFPRNDALTRRALRTRRQQRAFQTFKGQEIGMVVQPLLREGVPEAAVIYSLDLEEVAATVDFVRDRVLLATGAALLIARGGEDLERQRPSRGGMQQLSALELITGGLKECEGAAEHRTVVS